MLSLKGRKLLRGTGFRIKCGMTYKVEEVIEMFGLGMQELMIIMVIVVVLFGATRLPQLGSGIGKAISNFKQGINEPDKTEIEEVKEKAT